MRWELLLISLTCTVVISPDTINFEAYCNIKCEDKDIKHTICEHKCALARECVNFEHIELSDAERRYVRDKHNSLRNFVASGNDTRGENTCAKDMMVLNYHKEIELATLCMAKRCELQHDKCRHTLSFDSAGQNLAHFSGDKIDGRDPEFLNMSISAWYEEITGTCKKLLDKYPPESPVPPAHYTQIVWATTKYIGCSRVTYTRNNKKNLLIVCNYSPAGNIVDMPVYETGFGCARGEKPNTKYPALCGTIDTVIIGGARSRTSIHQHSHRTSASKMIDADRSLVTLIYYIIYNYINY